MKKARVEAAVAAATALAALLFYPCFKKITLQASPGPTATVAVIDGSLDEVHARTRAAYAKGMDPGFAAAADGRGVVVSAAFRFFPAGDAMFPADYQLRAWTANNPDLRAYLDLPAGSRSKDLYLAEVTGDYYWLSEYRYQALAVKFRCAFILHLESMDALHTRLQVLEYLPEVWAGERFGWSAHTGPVPGFFHDIRVVGPTTTDRAMVLRDILRTSKR